MNKLKIICFALTAANLLKVIVSFSDGGVTMSCDSMKPDHFGASPQISQPPYVIDPKGYYVSGSNREEITVTLRSNSKLGFSGFLLKASDQNGNDAGTFTLVDTHETRLLNCNGGPGSAVSQTHNSKKEKIIVKWKPSMDGYYTFRATFIQSLTVFWVAEPVTPPPTTSAPTSTPTTSASASTGSVSTSQTTTSALLPTSSVSTTGIETSAVISNSSVSTSGTTTSASASTSSVSTSGTTTSASAFHSSASTISTNSTSDNQSPFSRCQNHKWSTAMQLVSGALGMYGCLAKMACSYCKEVWFRAHISLMSLTATATAIAFIFLFIPCWHADTHAALVCVIMILTLIQIIIAVSRCGPSHELRFIFRGFHRLNALAIWCLTVAAIFAGLAFIERSPSHMLQKVMGGFVAWETLFFLLQLLLFRRRKKDWDEMLDKRVHVQVLLQIGFLIVFTVGNAAFLVYLLDGIVMA